MCGIIGASSKSNLNLSEVRLGMMLADKRGGHSTGFTDGDVILRATHDVKDFFKPSDKMSMPEEFTSFIGHTRYATAGAKSLANTHPFNYPNALGVHNGTIDNFDDLKKDFGKDALKYVKNITPNKSYIQKLTEIESDSMLLYYLINKFGLEDAVAMTKGTMGLVYYDEDKRLNIYRYDKPMCYGFKGEELWYASMKEYLEILGCKNIKPFTQHTHYVIDEGNVVLSNQLSKDKAPMDKLIKHSDDYDPDFEEDDQDKGKPEKKGSTVQTKNSSGTTSTGNATQPKEPTQQAPFDSKYSSPAYAKVGEREGEVIFWWFHDKNHNKLCIECNEYNAVLLYDLSDEADMYALKNDFEDLQEKILEEHQELELAADVKQDKKSYVKHQ